MPNKFQSTVQQKSDEELLSMVYQFDQWNAEMLAAVGDELQSRNLLPEDVATRRKAMVDRYNTALKEGKQVSTGTQVLGWVCVLGLVGVVIGYNLAFSKTTNKYTGEGYYTYNEPSRENGKYIFYASLFAVIILGIYRILTLRVGTV